MAQSWFTLQPFKMIEGKRPALFEAFDDLQLRVKHGFDYTSDAIVAAIYGIAGAVDTYAELPDPALYEPKTIYIVRQNSGAPSGNGLYWVQEVLDVNEWVFLDALNVQDAAEVPYDNTVSGIPETDVQGAIDWLKDNGGGGAGYTPFVHDVSAAEALSKSITLPSTPSSAESVVLIISGAPGQTYGVDYTVNLATPSVEWGSHALNGVLAEGDHVTIIYGA